jgi:hypothetical protein
LRGNAAERKRAVRGRLIEAAVCVIPVAAGRPLALTPPV